SLLDLCQLLADAGESLEGLPVALQGVSSVGAEQPVELLALGAGGLQLEGAMLREDGDALAAPFSQLADGDDLAVDPCAGPAVGRQAPGSGGEAAAVELALHQGALLAASHEADVGACASEQFEGVDDYGFASAGLAAEDVEA